ncbi:hypothetical protein HKX48_004945 [Thoreauomyces humboldtii]|nr:hypothetical protein HKX48_004945 [Thoreauomyces humboldtii]
MEPGLLVAYVALGILATVPIYLGSWAAIKYPKKPATKGKKRTDDYLHSSDEEDDEEEEEQEFFRFEDAYMFPVFGSAALLSLYLVFKYLNKEYLNALFTAYFSALGVGAVWQAGMQISRKVSGLKLKGDYRVDLWKKKKGEERESTVLLPACCGRCVLKGAINPILAEVGTFRFGVFHLALLVVSIIIGGFYAMTKHWILSNIYGEAFSTSAIQLLNLDSFKTGMALLAFLFFYDIFWVFGTDVMVTVAKGFDAPVKVLWPKDIMAVISEGLLFKSEGVDFTLLGLGDIVIPGIFVALCLKFDHAQYLASPAGKKNPRARSFPQPYFVTCFIAYVLGLVTTVVVMHNFQSAQPALLYLSPACILSVLLTGAVRGELKQVFAFAPAESSSSTSSVKKETKAAVAAAKKAANDTVKTVKTRAKTAAAAAALLATGDEDEETITSGGDEVTTTQRRSPRKTKKSAKSQ